jgi:hypothetical protein
VTFAVIIESVVPAPAVEVICSSGAVAILVRNRGIIIISLMLISILLLCAKFGVDMGCVYD